MHIEESVRKSEGLSKKEAERLEKMFEEIEEANPSMPPNIYMADKVIEIDSTMGVQIIDSDVAGAKAVKRLEVLAKQPIEKAAPEIFELIGQYTEVFRPDQLYNLEVKSGGWIANLSMPGYMDQTEPGRYDTLKEAIEGLHDMYADIG